MPRPTPEQIAEYEEWLRKHPESATSPETISGIIDDDVKEAEENESKRAKWDRHYNAKEIPKSDRPIQPFFKENGD